MEWRHCSWRLTILPAMFRPLELGESPFVSTLCPEVGLGYRALEGYSFGLFFSLLTLVSRLIILLPFSTCA